MFFFILESFGDIIFHMRIAQGENEDYRNLATSVLCRVTQCPWFRKWVSRPGADLNNVI